MYRRNLRKIDCLFISGGGRQSSTRPVAASLKPTPPTLFLLMTPGGVNTDPPPSHPITPWIDRIPTIPCNNAPPTRTHTQHRRRPLENNFVHEQRVFFYRAKGNCHCYSYELRASPFSFVDFSPVWKTRSPSDKYCFPPVRSTDICVDMSVKGIITALVNVIRNLWANFSFFVRISYHVFRYILISMIVRKPARSPPSTTLDLSDGRPMSSSTSTQGILMDAMNVANGLQMNGRCTNFQTIVLLCFRITHLLERN